jgi:DNA repair exonuclease SbcCD ATPase subunit
MAFSGEYMVPIQEAQKLERELADMTKQINPYEREAAKAAINALKRELAEITKQRDHYKAACDQYSEDEMLCELQDITKQRDEWKANHDNQVAINRALRDRPDLGERAKTVDALIKQRDALAEAIETLEAERKDLRDYPLRDAPGHSHDVKSTWDETGEPCSWCLAWDEARAALAATKGGSHE